VHWLVIGSSRAFPVAEVAHAATSTMTLATEFWTASSSARYAAAAPYALLLVAVSVPATIFLGMQARRGLVRGGEA
jgi:hypothetical protein